jgi:TniQ
MAPEDLYETWRLDDGPDMPERRRFYPMRSIGIGTSEVESLTGYVARLAEAHVLSVGDMVGREPVNLPRREKPLRNPRPKTHLFHAYSYAINGASGTARSWASSFERITGVSGLELLTLLPLRWTLSDMSLFRRHRAWCPQCYEEDHRNGIVYERLLWSLRAVTVCSKHAVLLELRCPICRKELPPLAVRSRPGHCSACGEWLGREKSTASASSEMGEDQLEFYTAPAVGDLLASMNFRGRVRAPRFRRNLRTCILRLTAGNGNAFAEITHTPRTTLRTWLDDGLPQLDALLRFTFHLGISVKYLLISRGLHEVDWADVKSRISNNRCNAKCYRTSEMVRKLLREALQDDACPSVPELGARLGYKRSERLRQVSPELCRQLTRRHRACHRTHWWREPGAKRIAELDRMRSLLEHSLKQHPPISVRRIAAQLGYSGGNAGFISRRFPDLCQSISNRLEAWKKRRTEELRAVAISATAEQPPPTLRELSRRLGFQTSTTLRYWAPDLADLLLKKRSEYMAAEKARCHAVLTAVLTEYPAPTLNSVARRLQCSNSFLNEHHPELCHAIAARHSREQKQMKRQRLRFLDDEVLEIARKLRARGLNPTQPRIVSLLSAGSIKQWGPVQRAVKRARGLLAGL